MSLLSPPTDSLAKFVAISGVVLFFGMCIHQYDVYKEARERYRDRAKEEVAMMVDSSDCSRRSVRLQDSQKRLASEMKRLTNISPVQRKLFGSEVEKMDIELQYIAKCSVDALRQQLVLRRLASIDSIWVTAGRDVVPGSIFFNVVLVASLVLTAGGFTLWHFEEQAKKEKAEQLYVLELKTKKAELLMKEDELKRLDITIPWLQKKSSPPIPAASFAPSATIENQKI